MVFELCLVGAYPSTHLFRKRWFNNLWLHLGLRLLKSLLPHGLADASFPLVLPLRLAYPFLLLDFINDPSIVSWLVTGLGVHAIRSFEVRRVSDLASCLWRPCTVVDDIAIRPRVEVILVLEERLLDFFFARPLLWRIVLSFWDTLLNVLRVRVEGGELLQLGDLLNRYPTLAVVRDLHDVKFDIT